MKRFDSGTNEQSEGLSKANISKPKTEASSETQAPGNRGDLHKQILDTAERGDYIDYDLFGRGKQPATIANIRDTTPEQAPTKTKKFRRKQQRSLHSALLAALKRFRPNKGADAKPSPQIVQQEENDANKSGPRRGQDGPCHDKGVYDSGSKAQAGSPLQHKDDVQIPLFSVETEKTSSASDSQEAPDSADCSSLSQGPQTAGGHTSPADPSRENEVTPSVSVDIAQQKIGLAVTDAGQFRDVDTISGPSSSSTSGPQSTYSNNGEYNTEKSGVFEPVTTENVPSLAPSSPEASSSDGTPIAHNDNKDGQPAERHELYTHTPELHPALQSASSESDTDSDECRYFTASSGFLQLADVHHD